MRQFILDFLFGPPHAQLAIAWFLPLIASAISGVAGSLLAPKAPQVDSSAFQLGAGLKDGSVNSPYFNYTNTLNQLQTQPSAASPYLDQQNEFRGRQMSLADILTGVANGTAPSLAQTIVDQNRQKGVASVMGAVASQPGRVNAALSQRLAATGVGAINAQALEQAKTGRLAEIQAAQQNLGQILTAGRAGDTSAGGLAVQDQASKNAAIAQILQLAQQREAEAARLSAEREKARLGQGNRDYETSIKGLGGALSGVGQAAATGIGSAFSTAAPGAGPTLSQQIADYKIPLK